MAISSVPILPAPARYSASTSCWTSCWLTKGASSRVPVSAMLKSLLSGQSPDRACQVSPLRLHTELASDDLDQILPVHPPIPLFEHENLLVCSSEEKLVEQIFVGSNTGASPVEQVEVPTEGTQRLQDKGIFEPDVSVVFLIPPQAAMFSSYTIPLTRTTAPSPASSATVCPLAARTCGSEYRSGKGRAARACR